MTTDTTTQIALWMIELNRALINGSTRERCEAAHDIYLKLLALRESVGTESAAMNAIVDEAIIKTGQLHDAFLAKL